MFRSMIGSEIISSVSKRVLKKNSGRIKQGKFLIRNKKKFAPQTKKTLVRFPSLTFRVKTPTMDPHEAELTTSSIIKSAPTRIMAFLQQDAVLAWLVIGTLILIYTTGLHKKLRLLFYKTIDMITAKEIGNKLSLFIPAINLIFFFKIQKDKKNSPNHYSQ